MGELAASVTSHRAHKSVLGACTGRRAVQVYRCKRSLDSKARSVCGQHSEQAPGVGPTARASSPRAHLFRVDRRRVPAPASASRGLRCALPEPAPERRNRDAKLSGCCW